MSDTFLICGKCLWSSIGKTPLLSRWARVKANCERCGRHPPSRRRERNGNIREISIYCVPLATFSESELVKILMIMSDNAT